MVIYANDFEEDTSSIVGAEQTQIDENTVLGAFHNDGFRLDLTDLPDHQYIQLNFRLFIHDSWDGNLAGPNGPDLWSVRISDNEKNPNNRDAIFRTTFSNFTSIVRPQSFPNDFPYFNIPKTGSIESSTGICVNAADPTGTAIYDVERIFRHTDNTAYIFFSDELKQTNSEDPGCDESWSLDDLTITIWN